MIMLRKFVIFCLMLVNLVACVSNPPQTQSNGQFNGLYDGKSQITFGTEIPVENAREAVVKGDHAFHKNDTDKALFYYVQALNIDENDPATFYRIGVTHSLRGNNKLAAIAYSETLRLDKDHTGALEGLGLIELDNRRHQSAKALLERVIKANGNRWKSLNALGIIADLNSEHDTAQSHYHAALRIVPDSTKLINNLGYSKYLAGDWEGAIYEYKKSLNLDPQHRRTWTNLGLVYTRRGQYSDAVDAFERVMNESAAYNNVGYICMLNASDGNANNVNEIFEVAEKYFLMAIEKSPKYHVSAHQNLEKLNILRNNGIQNKNSRGKWNPTKDKRVTISTTPS